MACPVAWQRLVAYLIVEYDLRNGILLLLGFTASRDPINSPVRPSRM